MKILLLNTDIGYGGAEKMLSFVGNTLAEKHEVTFLTYRNNIVMQTLSSRILHHHIQLEESGGGKNFFHTVRYLHDYIKENKFDIAIAFLTPSQIRLIAACKGTNTKIIFSQRGDPYVKMKGIKNRLAQWINYRALCKADYFVFQTEKARDFYPTRIQNRSRIICNPISPLNRTIDRNSMTISKTVVSVARLEIKQKRQDILIEAFCDFNKFYPEYKLEIYGDGPDMEIVYDLAKKNKNINVCGATSEVTEKIQNASMFVLSSDYEGIPNALLEAMSLGVPCISTDCSPGGAALLINDKKTGMLVELGNPNKLSEAMQYFASHEEDRERIGKAGMYVNQEFSAHNISKAWNDAVECLQVKRSRGDKR